MEQPGEHVYKMLWREQRSSIRANRRVVLATLVGIAFVIGMNLFIHESFFAYTTGAAVTALVGFAWFIIGAANGHWNRYMGGVAEEQTAAALKQLKRRGFVTYNNVPSDGRDIDFIAVGPSRVLAIEVKWTALPVAVTGYAIRRYLRDARLSQRRVQFIVNRAGAIEVTAVLIISGPGAGDLAPHLSLGGVEVLSGSMPTLGFELILEQDASPIDARAVQREIEHYRDVEVTAPYGRG
jgi:hypothetical protein